MATHRVTDLRKHLSVLDQLVHQHLAILVMHVIISRTMNKQQITFQSLGIGNRGTFAVAFRMRRTRQARVALFDRVAFFRWR